MNLRCPPPHFFYLWSVWYPTHFPVQALHLLLDNFEINTEMCVKNFRGHYCHTHREQKGDETYLYILKEKGEKREERSVKWEQ